jgi:hypothetical protein
MNPNASILGLRDPAMAALMGGISGDSFGAEFGDDYGDDYDDDDDYDEDDEVADDVAAEMAAEFGDDVGAAVRKSFASRVKTVAGRVKKFSAPARRQTAITTNSAAMRALRKLQAQTRLTNSRIRILEPNKGSSIKVERYSFTISQAITLGVAVAFTTLNGQPDTTVRPQRVTMNAPCPMFAFIQEIKVANVSVSVGAGLEDAFDYSAQGVGQNLDMPTLSPANRATILGQYTGLVPPGYVGGTPTNFCASFKGPASIVA